ncbi:MAG: hypothetical protein IT292_12420 [Deltaproteobacteria bacterium]|nr:hypothetical protein [Deltaproteobacteria bacterium]
MEFDDGEVLPGLNEKWTFFGATAFEWAIGLVSFMMPSIFAPNGKIGVMIPFMLIAWVLTTYSFASLRQLYPDEERGVSNSFMTACGFEPVNIPSPAKLQPYWSAAPIKELDKESRFVAVDLDKMFPSFEDQLREEEQEG